MAEDASTFMQFPCEITVKIMGLKTAAFEAEVFSIAKKHFPLITQQDMILHPSKNDKYLSINITITAESKVKMDSLYREFTASEHVIMAL